jgi:hypothetical protein
VRRVMERSLAYLGVEPPPPAHPANGPVAQSGAVRPGA